VQELHTGSPSSQKKQNKYCRSSSVNWKTLSGVIEGSKRGTVCTLYRRSPGYTLYSVQPGIGFWLYCFQQLTGQRFLGEHFGFFLAATRRLEEKIKIVLGVDFEDVMDLRPDERGEEGQKLAIP
jgi:hypothetical protein